MILVSIRPAPNSFRQAIGTNSSIELYIRDRSAYCASSQITAGEGTSNSINLPVRFFSTMAEKLVPISDLSDANEIRDRLNINPRELIYFYKLDLKGLDDKVISRLLLIRTDTKLQSIYEDFLNSFCHSIALRSDVHELLFKIHADREAFFRRALPACHSGKTPLQVALARVEIAEELCKDGAIKEQLAQIKTLIEDGAQALTEILAESTPSREKLDLGVELNFLAEEMKPAANAKNCTIILDLGKLPAICRVSKSDIRIAFRNLLDNAIKYSFSGSARKDDRKYSIRIYLNRGHGDLMIVFKNYGVGIPAGKIATILKQGGRANVIDPKAKFGRQESGFGLRIAKDIIEAHGGSIDISSRENHADLCNPNIGSITQVIVTLPQIKE